MLIPISVPNETVALYYQVESEHNPGYAVEAEPKRVTFDMIEKIEKE